MVYIAGKGKLKNLFNLFQRVNKKIINYFIANLGDGSIRYYELVNEEPYCHYVSQYITGFPQRGLGCMPKRGLDTSKCEIFRKLN